MSNPEKSGQPGDFPPPPPGPPPYQQQQQQQQQPGLLSSQQQDFAAPAGNQSPQELPAYGLLPTQTEASVQPPPEKSGHANLGTSDRQQEFPHAVGGASTAQQSFPPPPPGPPPTDQHNLTSEKQHFPPPPGGPPHAEGQSFPPPPGPAPTQDHPNPLYANPVNPEKPTEHSTSTDRPAERPNENYSIPSYDPAHPVFAPPPTNEVKPDHATSTSVRPDHGTSTTIKPDHPTSTAPATAHTPAAASGATVAVDSHKKPGWGERFSQFGLKAAAPINNIAHKLGSQSFLPETLDKECDKAATILTAFCKKGTYADPNSTQLPTSTATDPKATETTEGIIDPTKEKPKNRVLVKIPTKVISRAVGLAIFTTLRAGFQVSGAIGSGILIARLPDGSWGPPSGIQVNTLGGGFLIGLDIYDCVCVINNKEALAAFTNTRVSLGGDLAVVAGPYGAGGVVDFGAGMDEKDKNKDPKIKDSKDPKVKEEVPVDDSRLKPEKGDKKSNRRSLSASSFKPLFSYVKSRGFYAGLQIDGTVVVERKDANAAFYGERVSVEQILRGQVPQQGPADMWPTGARTLIETLRSIDASAFKGKAPEGVPPSAPRSDPVTELRSDDQPPAYVDDGTQRPGDVKYQYK